MNLPQEDTGEQPVDVRWPELLTALVLMGVGVLVIVDSIRVGTGWADDGPRAGYFPFYIGLVLLCASGWTALKQILRWKTAEVFAEREQIRSVMLVLVPMVFFVGAIKFIGIYLASTLLIGFFMRRHGKHGWGLTAAVSLGVPLLFFAVFERWFLVPLPKGPIESLLGF
jgi:putative tricarboxylic transport membrane protein